MESQRRCALALGLLVVGGGTAAAQDERCAGTPLDVDGIRVVSRFCIPARAAAPTIAVAQTFAAHGKTVAKTLEMSVVQGALSSRAFDDVDLRPLGIERSLHVTLIYREGRVELEHALALPGATPVK